MNRPGPQRTRWKRWVFSLPTAVILLVLVVLVGQASWNMYQTYRQTSDRLQRLQNERNELIARRESAQQAAAQVTTNRGLREEIREKFSVAKPGERVIVLNENQSNQATTTKSQESSWWQKLKATAWPF